MCRARTFRRLKYISPDPNSVWHADGYDKIKPYGFSIYGAIDEFSGHVLWLNITQSNNNSDAHVYFYINTVQSLKLCPEMLRQIVVLRVYWHHTSNVSWQTLEMHIITDHHIPIN